MTWNKTFMQKNQIWVVRVYIINGRATRKKLDYRSHQGYFMVYAATTWVILYWNIYQLLIIHRDHHVWFDEYNSCLSIEDKHTTDALLKKVIFMSQTSSTWFRVKSVLHPLHLVIQPLSHMKLSYLPLERKSVWFTGWWILYNPIRHWYNPKFTGWSSNFITG